MRLTRSVLFAVAALAVPLGTQVWAQSGDVLKASVTRLLADTGVWHAAKTGKTPGFVADPSWPQPLPHRWLLGQVGGLYVDKHDHIWVYNRPRTMTSDEAAAEGAALSDGPQALSPQELQSLAHSLALTGGSR